MSSDDVFLIDTWILVLRPDVAEKAKALVDQLIATGMAPLRE